MLKWLIEPTWVLPVSQEHRYRLGGGMHEESLWEVFCKTNGRCHFCGDRIVFKNRGYPLEGKRWVGHWEADPVFQRARGGTKNAEKCVPTCTR